MKCAACQYEYECVIDGETDEIELQKGDKEFIFLGVVNGFDPSNSEPKGYNQYACPKCGTVQLQL